MTIKMCAISTVEVVQLEPDVDFTLYAITTRDAPIAVSV